MKGKSLWSRILQRKYGVLHGGLQPRNASSRLWKALFPHFQHLQQMARWQIGRGDVKFWTDNWSGEVLDPASNSRLTVREALLDLNMVRSDLSKAQVKRSKLLSWRKIGCYLLLHPMVNSKSKTISNIEEARARKYLGRKSFGTRLPRNELMHLCGGYSRELFQWTRGYNQGVLAWFLSVVAALRRNEKLSIIFLSSLI